MTRVYQARVGQLLKGETVATPAATKTAAKKVNFKITEGQGDPLCEEYLKVLNRTAWDDLQACKLPDLRSSPIQEVRPSAISSETRNKLNKIIFEQAGDYPGAKWDDFKSQRDNQYETGYRTLGVLNWDLNKDGLEDLIVEDRQPWSYCEPVSTGDPIIMGRQVNVLWESMAESEKNARSKKYGFKKHYSLIDKENLFFIDAENMVTFKGAIIFRFHILNYDLKTTIMKSGVKITH